MHYYGDGFRWFHKIDNAASEIGLFCRKWGRISVTTTKEKYGTARVYCNFGVYDFHSLFLPGYVYNRWPKWLWKLNCRISHSKPGHLFFQLLNKVLVPYQFFIYSLAYNRAFKKYFYIFEEIYYGADCTEYIYLTKHSLKLYNRALQKRLKKQHKQIRELQIEVEESRQQRS